MRGGIGFFAGAAGACVAPVVVNAMGRRHRLAFYLAAYGGILAFTMMQANAGGVASGRSVLLMKCRAPIPFSFFPLPRSISKTRAPG